MLAKHQFRSLRVYPSFFLCDLPTTTEKNTESIINSPFRLILFQNVSVLALVQESLASTLQMITCRPNFGIKRTAFLCRWIPCNCAMPCRANHKPTKRNEIKSII